MGRRPQPERRAALLADCADELLRHGLPGLTLAKLATAAGTSSRMLLYHFSTRDQLVLEALQEARRQQQAFDELVAPRPSVPYSTVLTEAWDRITAPELRPNLRLFGQLHDLPADQTPWTEFRARSITDWLPSMDRVSGPVAHRLAAHDRGRPARRRPRRSRRAGHRGHRRSPRAATRSQHHRRPRTHHQRPASDRETAHTPAPVDDRVAGRSGAPGRGQGGVYSGFDVQPGGGEHRDCLP